MPRFRYELWTVYRSHTLPGGASLNFTSDSNGEKAQRSKAVGFRNPIARSPSNTRHPCASRCTRNRGRYGRRRGCFRLFRIVS
jgi:hypothetical protein